MSARRVLAALISTNFLSAMGISVAFIANALLTPALLALTLRLRSRALPAPRSDVLGASTDC